MIVSTSENGNKYYSFGDSLHVSKRSSPPPKLIILFRKKKKKLFIGNFGGFGKTLNTHSFVRSFPIDECGWVGWWVPFFFCLFRTEPNRCCCVTTRVKKNIIMALAFLCGHSGLDWSSEKIQIYKSLTNFTTPKSSKKSTQPKKRVKQQQKKLNEFLDFRGGQGPGGGGRESKSRPAAWYSKPGRTVTTTHKQESPIRSSPV